MGQSTYPPVSSGGSSYSSQPPENASSVLLDGQLVTTGSYSTTISGNGGGAYLYAGGNPATFTIGSTPYTVAAGSVVSVPAIGASTSVTVAATYGPPTTQTSGGTTSSNLVETTAYGLVSGTTPTFIAYYPQSGVTGFYSTNNGTSWTSFTFNSDAPAAVCFGLNYFVYVTNGSRHTGYSSNGYTWSLVSTGTPSALSWNSIAFNGTNFVAVAQATGTGAYSTNGTSWSSMSLPSNAGGNGWSFVTAGGGNFLASGYGGSNTYAAYSSNGSTWTANTFPTTFSATSGAYGSGTLVLVSGGMTTGIYSTNGGASLSTLTFPFSPNSINYGNGYFYLTPVNGVTTTAYSTNGTTWTTVSGGASTQLSGSFGNGYFVFAYAPGSSNTVIVAPSTLTPVAFGIYEGPSTTY